MSGVPPSQRLSIGELFVSLAVGLMFFLMPNDAQNQFDEAGIAIGSVFICSLITTLALLLIVKHYTAIGSALLFMAVMQVVSFIFSTIYGIINKGDNYWPGFSEYQLITIFVLWTVPFFTGVVFRLLSLGSRDTTHYRRNFARFMSLSLRALIIIYILVIVFEMIIPEKPNIASERIVNFIPLDRIRSCLDGTHDNGTMYIMWHCLILAPLTFSLLTLNPGIKWWHLLIICVSFGFTIELLQYSLNTSTACLDDMIMYLIGGLAGALLKYFIDLIRNAFTGGEEKLMLSVEYVPKKSVERKNSTAIIPD